MAAALAVPENAIFWEEAVAVNEDKLIHGKMIELLTDNKAEAVRAVQRLHRNLGRPMGRLEDLRFDLHVLILL